MTSPSSPSVSAAATAPAMGTRPAGLLRGPLDLGKTAGGLLRFGEALSSLLTDMGKGLLTPQLLNPVVALSLTGNPIERTAEGWRVFLTGGNLLTAEELLNKGEIFTLVAAVAPLIDEPRHGPLPLPQLVANAYALGNFFPLWAIEGLGHDYGDSFWKQGVRPHGILSPEVAKDLPSGSLPMLNAGIGLSMARTMYEHLHWNTPAEKIRQIVAEIVRLDRDNALPGYTGAAYENLGLTTRTLRATMVPAIDQAIREVAPHVRGYFWHGVGRSIYFWLSNFLPCSHWQIFRMAQREAPDGEAFLNAWAGAAWGYALVNQRQPRIMAELLIGPHGEELAQNGGFANGIASAMMMRFDTTPNAPFIEAFIRYRPGASNRRLAELWDRLVRIPSETALNDYYPVIKRQGRMGDIFEYRDLAAHVRDLQGSTA